MFPFYYISQAAIFFFFDLNKKYSLYEESFDL